MSNEEEMFGEASGKTVAEMEKEAFDYAGPDRVVHFTEFLKEMADRKPARSFKSGFPTLERKLGKLETGRVVVVSGHAKNGKTLFAESWIRGMLKNDAFAKAVMFSFEIQADQILKKYVPEPEMPVYLPLQLETMNFDWFKAKCLEAKLKYDARIILVDHLHFMVDMATKQNMSLNIGAFMRRLKVDIALAMNLSVVIIAHQGMAKDGEEASMNRARDSSFISQECDAFIVVSRRKNFNDVDFKDTAIKRGENYAEDLRYQLEMTAHNAEEDDAYSQGLALVKVECSRMSGTFGSRTLFRKAGEFLEEV